MEHQDWEYKVIEKKGTSKQAMEALNEQGRVATVAKRKDLQTIIPSFINLCLFLFSSFNTDEHLNKADVDGKHIAKVLNEENTAIDHVSHDFSLALQQAR